MVDKGDLAVQELARYMRELKLTHGSPNLKQIVARTREIDASSSVSESTVSNILNGRTLPYRENAEIVARAIGGKQATTEALRLWDEARRRRTEATAAGRTASVPDDVAPARDDPAPARDDPAPARDDPAPARDDAAPAGDDAAPAGDPRTGRRRLVRWAVSIAAAVALLTVGGVWLLPDDQAPTAAGGGTAHKLATLSSAAAAPPNGPVWTGKPPLAVRAVWSDATCGPTIWYDGPPQQYFAAWKNHTKDTTATELVGDQYSPPVDMTVQGRTEESVLLTGMEVNVLRSAPPPTHGVIINTAFGCGGAEPQRPFTADFGHRPVKVTADAGQDDDGKPIPPVRFPFKVSLTDPEDFLVHAKNIAGDCAFAIVLHWVADGKAGTTTLDNGGKGFRLISTNSLPSYRFNGDMERPALERVPSSS
ncbi:hypothetical protein AB0K09_18470 [Streptomyces sp. NPDC049577]|uniref:hypothetical protein n=1 Tax=Streptomyces sp. NPDC049577 TaxID=3155153 RepID=UPI003426B9BD